MKLNLLFTLAACMLMLSACSNDEKDLNNIYNGKILFSSGLNTSANIGDEEGDGEESVEPVDVPDKQIGVDQKVGIFVAGTVVEDGVDYKNVSAVSNGFGTFLNYSVTMIYPENDNILMASAYHPYEKGAADQYPFTVKENQSELANYLASDLLFAPAKEISRSEKAQKLLFVHKLCNVRVTLSDDLAGATVEVLTARNTVDFDRTTGAVSLTDKSPVSNIVLHSLYGAVMPAQTFVSGTDFIKVSLGDGVEFKHTLKSNLTLEWGKIYKYNVSVKETQLVVTSEVEDWTTGKEINGEANM